MAEPWRAGVVEPSWVRVEEDEQVALVASSKRELLLRVHRHRLRREDLEDCFSQATLELLAQVRAGKRFAGNAHIAHTLEMRFLSRVRDRRRAMSGRSPAQAALECALPLEDVQRTRLDPADASAAVERLVLLRQELRELGERAHELSVEQRIALASQLAQIDSREICLQQQWSAEKYRKLAQRGRERLRRLMDADAVG